MLFDGVPNDGIVAVDEAAPAPGERADIRTLHVSHTFMMNDCRVRALILELLGRPAGRP